MLRVSPLSCSLLPSSSALLMQGFSGMPQLCVTSRRYEWHLCAPRRPLMRCAHPEKGGRGSENIIRGRRREEITTVTGGFPSIRSPWVASPLRYCLEVEHSSRGEDLIAHYAVQCDHACLLLNFWCGSLARYLILSLLCIPYTSIKHVSPVICTLPTQASDWRSPPLALMPGFYPCCLRVVHSRRRHNHLQRELLSCAPKNRPVTSVQRSNIPSLTGTPRELG